MQTSTQTQTIAPAPVSSLPVLSSLQVIEMVRGVLKECFYRVNAYPCAPSAAGNLMLIHNIELAIQEAEATAGTIQRVKVILAQCNNLQQLAPKRPLKRRQTYLFKIANIRAACREYLGWRAQQ